MIKNKKHLFAGILAAVLAAAMVTASMAGCGKKDKAKATADSVVTDTQVVTEVVNGVYVDENGNIITDPSGNPVTAPTGASTPATTKATSAGSNQQSAPAATTNNSGNAGNNSGGSTNNNSGSANTNNNGGSNNSNAGNTQRKKTPSNAAAGNTKNEGKADDSAKNLTINGKSYNVGDKVVCTYYLEIPDNMLNFQGRVQYDSSLLKVTNAHLVEPANSGAMLNSTKEGKVIFNGSDLGGYDFTAPGYDFLVVEYEVLKTGTANPSITFEIITDVNGKAYAGTDGALSGGGKVWAVYE